MKKQKDEGKDTSSSHKPIEEGHIKQIYEDYFIPHWNNDPVCLQHKVCFNIANFLGKCRAEGLRELKKDSFEIKLNKDGREFMQLTKMKLRKNAKVMNTA